MTYFKSDTPSPTPFARCYVLLPCRESPNIICKYIQYLPEDQSFFKHFHRTHSSPKSGWKFPHGDDGATSLHHVDISICTSARSSTWVEIFGAHPPLLLVIGEGIIFHFGEKLHPKCTYLWENSREKMVKEKPFSFWGENKNLGKNFPIHHTHTHMDLKFGENNT